MWAKGGNIRVRYVALADSQRGFVGGTGGDNMGTEIKDCVMVGQTDNWGQPQRFVDFSRDDRPSVQLNHSYGKNMYESWTGVGFYQGPMLVDTCHFSQFGHYWFADHWQQQYGFRPVRPGAALSFRRDNIYPTKPWSYVKNVTFDYCDDVDDQHWVFAGNSSTYGWTAESDGSKALTFRDLDGSVTGQVDTQVVVDRPFYTGPDCVPRPSWHMTVCPYKYVQFEVLGRDGVLNKNKKDRSPLIVHRDDVPDDTLHLEGTQQNTFLARTHKSYTINFNADLGTVPTFLDIRGYGIEKGDVLRLGLCLPNDTTQFEVRSSYPVITAGNPHIMANSLQELDLDLTGRLFYWNPTSGMLYFKFVNNETRQTTNEDCANDTCNQYKIKRLDGGSFAHNCRDNPPIADTTPPVSAPEPPKECVIKSSVGLGAQLTDVVVADAFTITCPATEPITGRATPQYRGCFNDKNAFGDVTAYLMDTAKSMTRSFCQDRCYFRGLRYAALNLGRQCTCGDWFGLHGPVSDSKCSEACTGDPFSSCGGRGKLEVYTTGINTTKPSPAPCGPMGRGQVQGDVCVYLQLTRLPVSHAQRLCVRLGGNLVAIQSAEKQTAVELYLREHHPDPRDEVWSGLTKARDQLTWEQADGTPLAQFTAWKRRHGDDPDKYFVYLSGRDGYMWAQTKDNLEAHVLCDLPISTPPQLETCGERQQGVRLEPGGLCYTLLHYAMSQLEADYACHGARATLASAADREDEVELIRLLYRVGLEQDYWLDQNNRVMTWNNSVYHQAKVKASSRAGAICVSDEASERAACPRDWTEHEGTCYLSLGATVKGFARAAALCQHELGSSSLVAVQSQAENEFLASLTGSTDLLLDLRYTPRYDDFVWRNGEQTTFSAWNTGHGNMNLVNGTCAVLKPQDPPVWENADCGVVIANVICEMPVLV